MSVSKYNPTSGELELVAGGTLYADTPIGTVQATFDTTAPLGWLLLQGQSISRIEYAELLAWATARNLIGTGKPFGAGDGTTTFVLPDCREATLKGAGLTSKSSNHYDADGLALGEFIDDRIQEHQHYRYPGRRNGWNNPAGVGTGEFGNFGTDSTAYNNASFIGDSYGARAGATTEVKAVGVNYIIKAKQVALPADLESAVEDSVAAAVVKYNSPDWSNKVVISDPATNSRMPYTVPSDGWILCLDVRGNATNAIAYLFINGSGVGAYGTSEVPYIGSGEYKVNAGDVVSVINFASRNETKIIFIPHK